MIHIGLNLYKDHPISITISDYSIATTSVNMSIEQARAIALLLVDAVNAVDAIKKETQE